MPIEELSNEEVLQRCSMCQTATRSKLATLSLGVGSIVADDLDGRVVRLPPCPKCKAEEFLIRSAAAPTSAPKSYGDLHRLLVDQLHASLVKQGRFREDLYYRLNVFPIAVPPLRQRREDIPDLARRFLARFAAEEGRLIRGLAAEAMALLTSYDWPGNVRQLENALFRAVVLCEGDELTIAEFPQIANQVDGFELRIPAAPAVMPGQAMQTRTIREIVQVPVEDPNALRLVDAAGDIRKLDDIEREAIRFAIAHYRGQMSKVARKLSIGRSTLYRKLKDLGLEGGIVEDGPEAWAGETPEAA